MPAERIAMRQVRDVLRLNAAGVSGNEIARRVGVAQGRPADGVPVLHPNIRGPRYYH